MALKKKTVYYLRRDLSSNVGSVFAFLKAHNVSDACLIKSSSYSLHIKMFSTVKKKILNSFSYLIQDDTGIPLKDMTKADIQLFGHYSSPYGREFQGFMQNDLKKRYEETPNIPLLNFCFGYGCGTVQPNLMIVKLSPLSKT